MTKKKSETMEARLILKDGKEFRGEGFGSQGTVIGEVVFNTAMSGYQEILTDPSYYYQIITFTAPQIGNYGINPLDVESKKIYCSGIVVRENSPVVSHWQAENSLAEYLKMHKVTGIAEIDTRKLTKYIRDNGAQLGIISTGDAPREVLLSKVRNADSLVGRDIASAVTASKAYDWVDYRVENNEKKVFKVAVIDFGVKYSILRQLSSFGCESRVFSANTPADEILAWNPDGVFLSNGPGDPEPLEKPVAAVKQLLGRIPIFGICLGHQILGIAIGGKTRKLKFGHHGANHPVKYIPENRIEITSQNHGFIVDADTLSGSNVEITHINLNDGTLEGMRHKELKAFSVQYHPESSPGPHDSRYLFRQFIEEMKEFHAKA
ncbi:glutamine-hydrolyzing carbamoyl-phosphate synthase small subunit [candidate division KSB1 bacterium]